MTSKERVISAITFKPVDRVPTALFDGGVWAIKENNISFADLLAMEDHGAGFLINIYEKLDPDIVFACNGLLGCFMAAMGTTINLDNIGGPASGTPLINSIDEAKNLDKSTIREKLRSDARVNALMSQLRTIKAHYKDSKMVACGCAAPFTLAALLIGIPKFMEAIAEEDDALEPLFDYALALSIETGKLIIENGADIFNIADPVASANLINEKMFEDVVFPLDKQLFEAVGDGAYKLLHICGNTLDRLEKLKELPMDIFSLDSVDIQEAMKIADGKYTIFGNINTVSILKDGSAEEVSRISKDLCEKAGNQGGFILAAGCDIAPDTPIENLAAMMDYWK